MKVRDLGLVIDADLSMTSHVDNIIRICYFHIQQLQAIRRSLTTESTQALVRAFVHSRLDYCNGALAGLPGYTYKRLQAVLRSAARLCLRLPSFASVSDAMQRDLHWLNFQTESRISSVQWLICVNMKWPRCISEDTVCRRWQSWVGRSCDLHQLMCCPFQEQEQLNSHRSGFYFAGPSAWNSLPVRLRQLPTFEAFKKGPQNLSVWSVNLCFVFDNFTVHTSHLFIYNYLWMHLASLWISV